MFTRSTAYQEAKACTQTLPSKVGSITVSTQGLIPDHHQCTMSTTTQQHQHYCEQVYSYCLKRPCHGKLLQVASCNLPTPSQPPAIPGVPDSPFVKASRKLAITPSLQGRKIQSVSDWPSLLDHSMVITVMKGVGALWQSQGHYAGS